MLAAGVPVDIAGVVGSVVCSALVLPIICSSMLSISSSRVSTAWTNDNRLVGKSDRPFWICCMFSIAASPAVMEAGANSVAEGTFSPVAVTDGNWRRCSWCM